MFGNYVWKFHFKIFVWKVLIGQLCLEILFGRPTEQLLEAPSWSLKMSVY